MMSRSPGWTIWPLKDGRRFTILKAFHPLADLEVRLNGLGFAVTVMRLDEVFFALTAVQRGY